MSDSVWPHRRQPIRLLCPWDSPGKNTGLGCHFLLQYMKVKSESEVAQSCPTLSNPMDCSLPGSSVQGIFQARTLDWVAISFSNTWKWKVKVKSLSRARLLATPWTAAYQAPPSKGFSRQEYWSGVPLPSWTRVSCIAGRFFISWATREAHLEDKSILLATYWSELWILELVVRKHLSPLGNKVFYLDRVTLDLLLIFITDFHQ